MPSESLSIILGDLNNVFSDELINMESLTTTAEQKMKAPPQIIDIKSGRAKMLFFSCIN